MYMDNILLFSDCLITTAVNCFTSFFSGFVIFTYLGFMSHKQHKPISSVATEGELHRRLFDSYNKFYLWLEKLFIILCF